MLFYYTVYPFRQQLENKLSNIMCLTVSVAKQYNLVFAKW